MNFLARTEQLVVRTADAETLVYDLNTNEAYLLNETSALVWQLCDGTRDVSTISREVAGKFNQKANEDLIWLALDQLKTKKLLADADRILIPFAGSSRREAIKSIGLATMLALPVISALVAPQAAHAASGCGQDGQTCSADPNYTQGTCCTTDLRCTFGTCGQCITSNTTFAFTTCSSSAACSNTCNIAPVKGRCCNSGTATTTYNPATGGSQNVSCRCP